MVLRMLYFCYIFALYLSCKLCPANAWVISSCLLNFPVYFLILDVTGQSYFPQVVQSPVGTYGGEKFRVQPSVQVVDSQGLLIAGFTGTVYVQVDTSKGILEPLYLKTGDSPGCSVEATNPCGTKVLGKLASVPIVNGVGQFKVIIMRKFMLFLNSQPTN